MTTTTIGKLQVEHPEDKPVVHMTRTFNAPVELVFKAHSSCEHMSNWWGPRSQRFVSCELDFVEGGKWRIVTSGDDGEQHPFKGEFREIVPNQKLAWTFCYDVPPMDDEIVEEMFFSEKDGVTTITTTSYAPSFEARDAMAGTGMYEGAAETWDRLEEYAATLS
jgi:uncharacterized protein YndB with AHSA1/START domain